MLDRHNKVVYNYSNFKSYGHYIVQAACGVKWKFFLSAPVVLSAKEK